MFNYKNYHILYYTSAIYIVKKLNIFENINDWSKAEFVTSYLKEENKGIYIYNFFCKDKNCDKYFYRVERIKNNLLCYTYPINLEMFLIKH